MSRSPVAVLLFTRSAGEEAVHKRFISHGTRAGNAAVAAQLIHLAETIASRAEVDFVRVDSARQTGATFGERLTNAMRRVFGQEYEYLLVMGNDCPQLTEHLLRQAAAAVQQTGAVVGPATDGGVYLLGMSRAVFESQDWDQLPWQTAQLGVVLRRQLPLAAGVLPVLADVDDEQGLAVALRQRLTRPLLRRLRRLRGPQSVAQPAAVITVGQCADVAARPRRGPPAL
ncbi:TIGR04282 family arsenosugar biosynthesis glycosyltransferase [Hymenobacter negativus]|uniref:DUF2064 domain-containing protein n=1 Tax=Hymenobacter negativus TaxID=2795026 RepID=A0ABS0Q632_9BACT|nr:DUF2064 domain-containing protein [Hymenobacter negativus]MBH8558119.1 DUF2064 domain-containing protein [Hymenobacter negativus]